MSLPSTMHRPYCKRSPCSRATRIQRDLHSLPHVPRRPLRKPQQILQDILSLLGKKSTSIQARLESLQQLLSNLPAWTQWESREDDVMTSIIRDMKPASTDRQRFIVEHELADELMRNNGNVPYVTSRDFEEHREDLGKFTLLYTTWLSGTSSPEQKDCHVKDDHGRWIDDDKLREHMLDGWHLHIPTRTLHNLPQTSPARFSESMHDLTLPDSSRSPHELPSGDTAATSSALHRHTP